MNSAAVGLIHAKADLFVTTALCAALLSLVCALRSARRQPWGAVSFLCFAVALLSKETAFVLPIALALTPFLPYRPPPDARRWLAGWVGAAAALALDRLLPRLVGQSPFDLTGASCVPLGERLLTFAAVYVDCARKLALPLDPSVADTVTRFSALSGLAQALALAGFALLAALQAFAWRRAPWSRPWLLLWNLALLPVAQIVPLPHFRADRFLYLPSRGLVGLGVESGARLVARASKPAPARAAAALAVAFCAAFALLTAARVRDFESDERLFEEELRRTPDYVEGLSALARAHDRAGRHREAEPYWRLALAPHPGRISYTNYDVLVVDYSYNLLAQNHPGEAFELLLSHQRLVTSGPGREELRYNLAVAAFRLGRFAEALPLFSDYARAHPADARCRYLLGASAMQVGDRGRAVEALEAYLALAPEAPDRRRIEAWLAELERP